MMQRPLKIYLTKVFLTNTTHVDFLYLIIFICKLNTSTPIIIITEGEGRVRVSDGQKFRKNRADRIQLIEGISNKKCMSSS